MNRSIFTTPSNKRVFVACLLSLLTLIAPIASVSAATRRVTVPTNAKTNKTTESAPPSLVEPPAAMPAPVPASLPAAVPAPAPAPVFAVGPITASKVDAFTDADGDGKAELGETITYSIGITNTGTDPALGVTFNDNIDANTTFVPGSMHASPIAFDDTYDWVGNTVLDTAARSLPSATANDVAVTDTFTVDTQTNAPTTQGGSVTLAANGHFVYTPQLGDGGPGFSDTFTYTIRNTADNTLAGTGTVTINMPVRVWYMVAGGGGDGRSHTPSGVPATISTAANLPSDILYVIFNASTLNGAFTLDSGQILEGEGVALVANSITLRPAASTPTITNTTGNAVTLGGSNLVTGLNISQANNFAIAGNAISGTTNITGVAITNSATGGGISLTTQAGTFNMTNSPISGTTSGTAVLVSGGTGAINFSNSPVSRTTGRLLDIQTKTGGSVLFNGGSTVTGTAITTDAIVLLNHTGGTTFTFSNNVNITTTTGRGIRADNTTGSFSLTMNAAANTISATGGAALDVEDVAANMAFTSTSSTNSSIAPAHGLRVSTTTGSLSFGTTAVSGSANTGVLLASNTSALTFGDLDINPAAGQRGLHATENTGTITTTSGTITTTTGTGVEITKASPSTPLAMVLTLVSVSGAPSGIVIQNNTGSFSVIGNNTNARNGTGGVIANTTDDGIRLTNANNITLKSINLNSPGDTLQALLADNEGTLGEHGVEANGGSNIILSGVGIDSPAGSGMIALNITGTSRLNLDSLVTNIDNPATHGLYIRNTSGFSNTLFEVNDTNFTNSSSGASNMQGVSDGTANVTIEVRNGCLFDSLNNQAITLSPSGAASGTLTTLITGNTFSNGVPDSPGGVNVTSENNVGVLTGGGGTHNTTVSNNLFDNVAEDGRVANTSVIRTQNSGGKMTAVVSGNTIQNINFQTGAGGRHVIGHVFEPVAYNAANFSNLRFENNVATNVTFTATNREFIFIDYRQDSSGGDIKILGNNWNMPTSASTSEAIDLNFRGSTASTVDVQVDNNGNGTGAISNTGTRFLRIDVEEATIGNITVTNNKFTNSNGAPGTAIDFSTNDDGIIPGGPPTMCVNVSGNNVTAAGNTIRLNEAFGTMNVTQASSAAVSTANNSATVTVVGTPTFGAPACQLPSNLNFNPDDLSWGIGTLELPIEQPAAPLSNSVAGVKAQPSVSLRSKTASQKNSVKPSSAKTETAQSDDQVLSHHPVRRSRGASTATALKSAPVLTPLAPMPPLTPLNIGTLPGGKVVTVKFQVTVNTTGLGAATSVSNQGNVTYTGGPVGGVLTDDPAVGGATDPTVTPISRLDVQVTKTDGVATTTPGSDLTYTLTYTNNDHAANGVVLTETVPVGTTFKAAGSSVWTGCANGAPAGTVCTINLGNLPRNTVAGFTGTRTFVVTVLNPAPAGLVSIVNTGSIAHDGSYEPDINTANNTTTDTDTLTAVPDLNISKSDGVVATTPGSTLTYAINYSNVGNQNATGVVLTETVPTGTTFVAAGSSAWTGCANGAAAGTVCTISVGSLNGGGGAGSATFVVLVTNPAAAGLASIVNTASIADDGTNGTDPTLPNTATDTDTLTAAPDLTISKVPDVSSVGPADVIVYTISYANAGNQNATGVAIYDTVPLHTTFSAANSLPTVWSCADNSPAATTCSTTIGALSGGGSGGTVKFAVKVVDPIPLGATQISNTANIVDDASNGADPNPGNNTTGPVITPIITCTPPPANMVGWWSGDNTPRDIAGGNDGTWVGTTSYAPGKVAEAFSFNGASFVTANGSSGPLNITGTEVTIDGWVNPAVTAGAVYFGKTASGSNDYLLLLDAGQLSSIIKTSSGEKIVRGFSDYPTNAVPFVPPVTQWTHIALTYDGALIKIYANGVLVGQDTTTGNITGDAVPFNIGGRAGSLFFNGLIDEVEVFNRALAQGELQAIFNAGAGGKCKPSDLKIAKSHADPFIQGSSGNTYTITVTNDGPATTTGTTTVTENLPAGLTATSMSGGINWTCGGTYPVAGPAVRTCTSTQAVAAGGNFDPITLTVTAGANMASVINNVTVSGGGEMDTSDDSFDDTTNLTPVADLLAVKIDSPDPVTAGTNITYAVTLTNNGPSDAQSVTLTDAVPANTTFVSAVHNTGPVFLCANPSVGGTGNVVCSIATMPAGTTSTFTIVVNVNANTPEGTTITNNAVAASTTGDSNSLNNTGTATTAVIQSDIEITSKTDLPDPVEAGQNITYTVNFKNNSAVNTASNVTVTDAVPTGTTLVSATTASPGWARTDAVPVAGTGNIVFSKALVAGAETAVFTIVVKVDTNVTAGTIVTNTATAATTSLDTVGANNSANTTTTVTVNADLQITSKTDTPDPVLASQNITYAINFVNNGPSDAQGVTVTDAVPTGTTFVSASVTTGSGWTIADPGVGNTGNVVFSKATVATGETAIFEVVVKVNNNAVDGSIVTNNAVAAGTTTDPTPGNNTGTATTNVNQSDIEITSKTDLPDPVEAGQNITYTVNFKNNSAVTTASNVTVTDAVPTGTTLVSATTASPGWARTDAVPVAGTGNIVFSKALVAGAETAVFTIVVKVDTNVTAGTIISNTATAATTSLDTVGVNNSATTTTTVTVNADLQITSKTDTPDPVLASQNITYAINFVNNGPSDAQGVTVTDAVPTGTTFVSALVTTGSGWTIADPGVGNTGNVVFSKATVATGETAIFEVVVKVNNNAVDGSIVTNNAVAAGTTTDPTPGNNTGTATTNVNQSDIEITSKTDLPDPVEAGQNITYTVNFKNNSAVTTASNVTVTDAVPAGTTLVSATTASPGWSRTDVVPVGGTGNIVFSKALVAGGETAVFTIVVKVDTSVTAGTIVTNTATAATTSLDTVAANNSATATTTVNVNADLEIVSKTDTPDPVTASQNLTYTINFRNNGPSDAQTVTVTDAVPAGTTFVSAIVPGGWSRSDAVAVGGTGNVVFTKPTVINGETATFTLVVQVNANAVEGATITNTATAAGATNDPTLGNDSKTATTTVNQSDIEITSKTDLPDPVTAGQDITYTVNFKNNSAVNTASNVTVTDAVPTGTTLVSATTASPGWSRTDAVPVGGTGNIVFSKALVAASETAVFTIVVKVNTSVANGTVITNTATAATSSLDTNSTNNSATATTTVQVVADLEITSKTDTPDPVVASQNITYTINFVNNGPSDAQTVTVTDAVPTGTTLVSATTASPGWSRSDAVAAGGTGNIVFAKATVPSGETATFTIVVQVNANAVEGSTITNTATAAGAVTDPTPANNSKTANTTVQQSDIEITSKTDLPDPVTAGNNITYTVNFKNNSALNTASNVTVTDAVPTGTTLVSATTASPGWSRTDAVPAGGTGNIVFSKALVAASETATFTIVVKVSGGGTSTVTNTATAATSSIDTNSANNSATATTTVETLADLEITSKTDTPDPVIAGENLTYTINFVNNGPSDAQTVTVTDAVPANTTLVSATFPAGWSRSDGVVPGGTGNVVFTKATAIAGETATFTLVVKVNASTLVGTILSNTATAASATTDNTPGNNSKTATTTVATSADLLVVKIDSPDPVVAGNNLTYTITVTNNGVSDAQSVQLSDTLPASTTLVSFTVPAGWTRTDAIPAGGTGTVTATIATLAVGASAQFTLVVNVNGNTPHNTVLTNSATVSSTTNDPNTLNNTGSTTTTVLSQPDLTITKSHSGNFSGGQVGATYVITVNNIGTGPTTAPVTVTDIVPVGLTPTGPNGVVNGWSCSISGQTLTCTRSDVLAGSSSYPAINLTVNVANPAPANVTNTATVSGGGEVNTGNNTATDPTAINCSQDFGLNNTNPLMISRFRMNGPAGPQDEYVEIFNSSTTPHTVASGICGGSGGYGVYASAGNGTTSNTATLVCSIPNGTVIPAGGYYLCTGITYSLGNLGRNGGAAGATATGDAPIGCGGSCGTNIPDDAGLVLFNQAVPTIAPPPLGGFNGLLDPGLIIYDKLGFEPYGAGAPAPTYPSLAATYCEGGNCLKPVGDANTGAACANPTGLFPVFPAPPACYGLAGQYGFVRRQTTFDANLGTLHQDTNNSSSDFLMVTPNPTNDMGVSITGVLGVSGILGAAGPFNSTAPPDIPAVKLTRTPFDGGNQQGPLNLERRYIPDPTIANPANDPLGTLTLRFKYTNNSGSPINGIRFSVDNLSTLCGPQSATPAVGTGDARNVGSSPTCAAGSFTAIFKALNSPTEIVVDSSSTARMVSGTVLEDLSVGGGPGPLSPNGGGMDNTYVLNPSMANASVGDGVTGGVGNFATSIGTSGSSQVLRVQVKFGVVKNGRFILLLVPMAKPTP